MPIVDCARLLDEGPPALYLLLRELAMAPHSSGVKPGRPEVRRTSGMEAGARRCVVLGAAVTSGTAARDSASNGSVAERIITRLEMLVDGNRVCRCIRR